jgi:hypothetical protein
MTELRFNIIISYKEGVKMPSVLGDKCVTPFMQCFHHNLVNTV